MSHSIWFKDIQDLTVRDAVKKIRTGPRKEISDLGFPMDLISDGSRAFTEGRGVYVMYEADGACEYVGVVGSSSFIHRISSHFALWEEHYENHLVKKLRATEGLSDNFEAAKRAMPLHLQLIHVPDHDPRDQSPFKAQRRWLEPLLQARLEPRLNGQPRRRAFDADLDSMRLIDALDRLAGKHQPPTA